MIYHWYPLIIIRDIHGTVPTCTNYDSIHRRPAGSPPPEPPQCSASSRALGPLLQRADLNVVERCCGWATLPEFHGIWEKQIRSWVSADKIGGWTKYSCLYKFEISTGSVQVHIFLVLGMHCTPVLEFPLPALGTITYRFVAPLLIPRL